VEAASGSRPAEALKAGDLVWTLDRGFQPVKSVTLHRVDGKGDAAPVRFAPGTIGNDRALVVSPWHRVLLSGWRCQALFGEEEVLCEARYLVNGSSIDRVPRASFSFVALLFARHEILRCDGALMESLLGSAVLQSDVAGGDSSVAAAFGWETEAVRPDQAARRCLRSHEAQLMQDEVMPLRREWVRVEALRA
jgi:serralysin